MGLLKASSWQAVAAAAGTHHPTFLRGCYFSTPGYVLHYHSLIMIVAMVIVIVSPAFRKAAGGLG
jgi:hypothetical protein